MPTIGFRVKDKETADYLDRVNKALTPKAQNRVLQRVAWSSHGRLVRKTPKGWTGLTRQRWEVVKVPSKGFIVTNTHKVMLFLEKGTKDHGAKNAKMLFIPLTRSAALSGWHPRLKRGRDYILKKRVKGITAMNIVREERTTTSRQLRREMVAYIQSIL